MPAMHSCITLSQNLHHKFHTSYFIQAKMHISQVHASNLLWLLYKPHTMSYQTMYLWQQWYSKLFVKRVAGYLSDECGLPGVDLNQLSLLPCPILSFPVILSEHPVQSNPGWSLSDPPFPSLPVLLASLLRCHCEERLTCLSWTWVRLTERVLTPHCSHNCLSFLPPTTCHPLTSTAPRAKGEQTVSYKVNS